MAATNEDYLREAIRAVARHQYPHAMNSVEILLARLERFPEDAEKMLLIAYETGGDASLGMGEFGMAEDYFNNALALIDEEQEPARAVRCQLSLAECYLRHGNIRQARHLVTMARESQGAAEDNQIMARVLAQLGTINWVEGELDVAISFLEESVGLFEEENVLLKNRARSSLGIAYSKAGRVQDSQREFHIAMDRFQAAGDFTQVVRCLNNLAGLAFHQRDWNRAKEYLLDCVELETETQNRADLAYSWYNLGLISLHEMDYRLAKKYLNRSFQLSQEVDDRTTEASSLLQLGIVTLLDNQPQEAVNFLVLAHGRMEGSTSALATTLNWYSGLFHCASSEIALAEEYWAARTKFSDADSANNLLELAEHINAPEYADAVEMIPRARELAAEYLEDLRKMATGRDVVPPPDAPEPIPETGE